MLTQIKMLSEQNLKRIHERSLHVLAKTGVRVDTEKGRYILEQAGAISKKGSHIIRFPEDLVEQSIRSAPPQFILGGRREAWSFSVNTGQNTLCLNGEGTSVIDRDNATVRPATRKDWLEVTRMADFTDEVGVYWRMVTPHDMGDSMADFVDYTATVFRNFSKHIMDPFMSPEQAPWLLEILQAVFGDRETIKKNHPYSTLLCPQSPLMINEEYTNAYLELKGWNIPVAVMPMALMGATAPASMLATLIQCNCEVLATLCLIQANEPGTPFLYAPALTLMDPKTGRYFSGGAENAVMNSAAVELARFYGFPIMGSGFGTDAFLPSRQGGYERALNTVLPLLEWPDILVGPGLFGGDMMLSFDQFLVDLEMYRMIKQIRKGMDCAEDKWLDSVIERVGPGGNYLMEDSTLKAVRSDEWYIPQMGVHDSYANWLDHGSPMLDGEAREKVSQILSSHRPDPLDENVEHELSRIHARAQKVTGHYQVV
ncbi:MAG: trimethylamine methyltransferase family protein [Deltaproteobacteria bacterium]|nr:trimethylamine methyltransferase family protein [Deltaproteobacteria bacterium]